MDTSSDEDEKKRKKRADKKKKQPKGKRVKLYMMKDEEANID